MPFRLSRGTSGDGPYATVAAPIADAVRAAGGNAKHIRQWFDADRRPVYRFVVHGKHALRAWRALRERVSETGHWPLIIGEADSIRCHDERRCDKTPVPNRCHRTDSI